MRHPPAFSSLIPGLGVNPMPRPSSSLSIRYLLRRDVLLYVAARVGQSVLVLWAAFTLSFAILYVLPGDPVSIMVNQDGQSLVDGAELAKLKAEYNLDKPITEQYFIALWRVLHLDFGKSIQSGQTVASALANAIPPTANLAFCALVVALIMGVSDWPCLVVWSKHRGYAPYYWPCPLLVQHFRHSGLGFFFCRSSLFILPSFRRWVTMGGVLW